MLPLMEGLKMKNEKLFAVIYLVGGYAREDSATVFKHLVKSIQKPKKA